MKIKEVLVRPDGEMVHAIQNESAGGWLTVCGRILLKTSGGYYSRPFDGTHPVNCKKCLAAIGRSAVTGNRSNTNDDTYYEIRFNDDTHEIVTDVGSAQEAAEWAADAFDFNLSDIICIRRYKFEKEIFPVPAGIKFED